MNTKYAAIAALTAAAIAQSASAAIFFTFDDPTAEREVTLANDSLTYDTVGAPVDLVVDATQEGAANPWNFNAFFDMDITIGAATPSTEIPGAITAPISGSFSFDIELPGRGITSEILRGEFQSGTLLTIDSAGAVITTSASGGLVYTASNDLLIGLNDIGVGQLFGIFDAVFTLTNITPTIVTRGESFDPFTASAAYTGTATVPAPGAISLFAATGFIAGARRRRKK